MVKKNKTKSVKKQVKNKNKNININIHIDQSKRTTGSNPKKSNIKTLPAFSSAPSSGGNYVRQFAQDPYYTQSQYEHMNLLQQYNNLIKQNKPQITNGFQDKNKNDQQLLMNSSTINREYKIDDDTSFLNRDDDSIQGRLIDFEMNDDPRTDREPENMLVRNQIFQQLPYNDLNTQEELLMYNKTPMKLLKIEDGELKSEQTPIEDVKTPPPAIDDDIMKAMNSQDEYYKGSKIFRSKDIPDDKVFNITTGLFVKKNNKDYLESLAKKTSHNYYTDNPYEINKVVQRMKEGEIGYNHNWARYKQVKKSRKIEKVIEEKADSDNDPDEIFIDANKGTENALNTIVQSSLPPPPPVEIKIRTKPKAIEADDNKSNSSLMSSVRAIFSPNPKVSMEEEVREPEMTIKFKPKAMEPKAPPNKPPPKVKSVTNKIGIGK